MRPHTDFKPETSKAILLIGDSGSGKTNLAFEFPNPGIIDFGDANINNAVERHRGKPFKWGRVDLADDGKTIAPHLRWQRSLDLLVEAGKDPDVQTIVDDSLSMLQVVLTDYLVDVGSRGGEKLPTVAGEKQMNVSLWEPFARALRSRIVLARSLGKTYIMTCHVKVDENELTATKEQRPLISGQMASKLASLYTDYWMCEATPTPEARYQPRGVRYFVRTAPTNRIKLKSSVPDLPPEFEFSWASWQAHLAKRNGGVK